MSTDVKIILSAIICALVATLLFLVVPATGAFVISYIFALIAIGCIAGTLFFYNKSKSGAVASLSYVYAAAVYGSINILFSIIAYLMPFSALWTLVIHIALLASFSIKIIALSGGSDYINKLDELTLEKRKKIQHEKNNYWNKKRGG